MTQLNTPTHVGVHQFTKVLGLYRSEDDRDGIHRTPRSTYLSQTLALPALPALHSALLHVDPGIHSGIRNVLVLLLCIPCYSRPRIWTAVAIVKLVSPPLYDDIPSDSNAYHSFGQTGALIL
jgi:hypothetical protein